MKRFALGAVLVVAIAPLATAQYTPSAGAIGNLHPILIDTDGNGPDVGDGEIVPDMTGPSSMVVPNPWDDCNPSDPDTNELDLTRPPLAGPGPFTGGRRDTENQTETLLADQFAGGRPTRFLMNVNKNSDPTYKTGTGQMLDTNGDGIFDAIQGSGGVTFQIGLLLDDADNDSNYDHVSVPWGQASALGVRNDDGCMDDGVTNLTDDPQIWVPLADTTGDGIPDAVALDLDDDGDPDPEFLLGPLVAGPANIGDAVPTLTEWASIAAALALAAVAWLQIRAHGLG